MTDRYFSLDGVRLHIVQTGHGDPLVLLHGFTGSADNWRDHATIFGTSRQVIAIDLLGHGTSESPLTVDQYLIERQAAQVAALIGQLGAREIDLLGYSMGGRLALYFVLEYPHLVRALILESSSPGIRDDGERETRRISDEQLAGDIERDGIELFVAYWENLPLFASQKRLPDATRQRLRDQRLANNPTGLANSLRGMGAGVQPSLWGRLGELSPPALLITGALDPKYVEINERMAATIPTARLGVIPNAGHTTHLEQPNLFRQSVNQFLNTRA